MVPHSSNCANSKLEEYLRFISIYADGRQIGHNFAGRKRILVLPQKPVVKVLPREGQLQGINSPQTSADCRTSCHGQQRPPTAPQLRHQRLPVDNNQRLEQASHSAELLIRTRPRTRDGTATPPKWPVGSLCSSFPHSAGPLPEQSFKYKQPPPCADSCAVAVSDSLPFSAGQAKVQRVLPRPRHLSADPAGQGCYQHGFVKHWTKAGKLRVKTSQTAAQGVKAHYISDSGLSEGILLAVCDLNGGPPKNIRQVAAE